MKLLCIIIVIAACCGQLLGMPQMFSDPALDQMYRNSYKNHYNRCMADPNQITIKFVNNDQAKEFGSTVGTVTLGAILGSSFGIPGAIVGGIVGYYGGKEIGSFFIPNGKDTTYIADEICRRYAEREAVNFARLGQISIGNKW